jgi:hypothetical protein
MLRAAHPEGRDMKQRLAVEQRKRTLISKRCSAGLFTCTFGIRANLKFGVMHVKLIKPTFPACAQMVNTVVTLGEELDSLGSDGDMFQIGSYVLAGTSTSASYPVECNNDFTVPTRRRSMHCSASSQHFIGIQEAFVFP